MIGQKLLVDAVVKIIKKTFKFDKVLDYVENPNDADKRIDELEMTVFHQGKLIDRLMKDSHPQRDFVICEKCKKQIKEIE
tara:strand:- start:2974 stop:3213 length:240 start_codon:yes stop_codon:yes gene_type:complete